MEAGRVGRREVDEKRGRVPSESCGRELWMEERGISLYERERQSEREMTS